jgi:serine protease AprX
MNNNRKSDNTSSQEGRLLNSPVFSAGWGRALGLSLLMLSGVPAFAGDNAPKNDTASLNPHSVVWGVGGSPTVATVVTTATTLVGTAATSSRKFSADLMKPTADSNGMVSVIVQHRQMPTVAHLQAMRGRGATIKTQFHTIRAVAMRVPVSMLAELENDPNVAYVTPDRNQKMASNPVTEEYATAIGADVAQSQYGFDGTGVGVAVIDSGIAIHPDLNNANGVSRVVYSQSFVAGDSTTSDKFGHGTHVAGLIGASGASSGTANGYAATYAGMAPNVNLINLRVLDQNGSGTDSGVIAAIEAAIALRSTYNIRVINMSLGRPVFESYTLDPVDQAVEAAWKAGIVVVTAAGNNGRYGLTGGFGTVVVPGNDPSVITVGATMTELTATRVDDQIASYSSKGPTTLDHIVKPDITAPGNRQVSLRVAGSTLDTTYPEYEVSPTSGTSMYYELSGTSMATPIVSGAVALMLQQTPSLNPDQVKARLMKTAWKGVGQFTYSHDSFGNLYNNEYDLFTYGAGYLNIDAALSSTDVATGSALSPTAVLNSNGSVTINNTTPDSNFAGSSVVWGATSVVWGNSVVWGANAISASSVVWGSTSVVWGATSVTGDSVVWGATSNVATTTSALSDGDPGDN